MPERSLEKLEADLHDLEQDIRDSVAGICKGWGYTRYTVSLLDLERKCVLLNEMLINVTNMNMIINRFLSLTKQGMDLVVADKKLQRVCNLVKEK